MPGYGTQYGNLEYGREADSGDLISLSHVSDYIIRLTCTNDLQTAGAPGVALLDVTSYEFSANAAGLPAGIFNPTTVNVLNDTIVDLTIPLTTRTELYNFEIVGALETISGIPLIGATDSFTSNVSLPIIDNVITVATNQVQVVYSRDMVNNADLINSTAYIFNGGLYAVTVTRIDAKNVLVTLNTDMIAGYDYTLSVNATP